MELNSTSKENFSMINLIRCQMDGVNEGCKKVRILTVIWKNKTLFDIIIWEMSVHSRHYSVQQPWVDTVAKTFFTLLISRSRPNYLVTSKYEIVPLFLWLHYAMFSIIMALHLFHYFVILISWWNDFEGPWRKKSGEVKRLLGDQIRTKRQKDMW